MGKTGTIWQFVRALFRSAWRTLSPDALFTRIRDTRKRPEFAPHFRAFPASIQEHSPPKCLFSWQTLNCQIVPGLPSYFGKLAQLQTQSEKILRSRGSLINRHPPSRPPKSPFKIPKDLPLLVWECLGVHIIMEICRGKFWEWGWGFWVSPGGNLPLGPK